MHGIILDIKSWSKSSFGEILKLNLGAHENAHKMGQWYAVHQMLISPIKTFLKTIVYNELTVTCFDTQQYFSSLFMRNGNCVST